MAFANRYTGKNVTITATPTGGSLATLSGDFTNFQMSEAWGNTEVTAGNEKEKSYLETTDDLTFTIDSWGGNETVWDAVRAAHTGVITIQKTGVGTGLPEISFSYILDSGDEKLPYDNAAEYSISGKRSGAMLTDFGSVQT
jgi:hypothetical protein